MQTIEKALHLSMTCSDKELLSELLRTASSAELKLVCSDESDDMRSHRMHKGWSNALKYGKQALTLSRRLGDKGTIALDLNNVAEIYIVGGQANEALRKATESMKLCREGGFMQPEAFALLVCARAHLLLEEFETARDEIKRAIALLRQVGDNTLEAEAVELLKTVHQPTVETVALSSKDKEAPVAEVQQDVPVKSQKKALDPAYVQSKVMEIASNIVGDGDELELDAALMESGMDSLSMVSFRNEMQKEMEGVRMPATLVFEYPSIRALVTHIVESSADEL